MKKRHAFTLVELLIVIAILAVLSVVVFVVINPGQRLIEAQNAQVKSNVQTIQKAFELYAIDHNGDYPLHDGGAAINSYDYIPHAANCNISTTSQGISNHNPTNFDSDTRLIPTYLPNIAPNPYQGTIAAYKIYRHTSTNQIIVCSWLNDITYHYPPMGN